MPLEWAQRMDSPNRSQSRGKYQNGSWVGSLQHAWDVRPGNAWPVAGISLLAAQERVVQSQFKWWGHLSFFNRDGATSGRVIAQVWDRELQRAAPMEHPEGPSHVIGSIAERLTRSVSGNLSEWSRITWALHRTDAPQEQRLVVIFSEISENWGTLTQW